MKKAICTLLAAFVSAIALSQEITVTPAIITFTTPVSGPAPSQNVTISASGLSPAAGYIVITGSPKYPFGSVGGDDIDTLSYSGGILPPTSVTIYYVGPNIEWNDDMVVAGGGASTYICACSNAPSCPCAVLSVGNGAINRPTTVSPNPATNELFVSAPYQIASVAISNLIGNIVYRHAYNSESARIDISGLPCGIYLLKINDTEVRKFVKQ